MSDGPYRSLPMRPGWKTLAKRGQQHAFEAQDICDAVCPALAGDWTAEISAVFLDAVRAFCDARQGSLFGDERAEALNTLRREAFAAGTLGMAVADFAAQGVNDGIFGHDALCSAIENALLDRAVCGVRGVEEHFHRESTAYRASFVRRRLEDGVTQAMPQIKVLAERIAAGAAVGRIAPPKHTDLEDGAPLP